MTFSEAFHKLRETNCGIRLENWSPDVKIKVQTSDLNSKMTHSYLYVESRYGKVPWLPTQVELFSVEWETAA